MPELLRFNNHIFSIDTKRIKSFKDLKVKTQVGTEDTEDGGSKYVTKKTAGTTEVDFTAIFTPFAGVDAQSEALALVRAAQDGETGYLYIAGAGKLWPFKLMITDTEITETIIGAGGKWTYAAVRVTMKQCERNGGGAAAPSSGSSGGSGGGGGGGGGGGTSTYTVQISGMSAVKISAKSVQDAITKAAGDKYTGNITVNGKTYNVVNGKISTATQLAEANKQKATKEKAEKVSTAVTNAIKAGAAAASLVKKWTTPKTPAKATVTKPAQTVTKKTVTKKKLLK